MRYLFFISYPLLFIIGGVAIGITLSDRQVVVMTFLNTKFPSPVSK